MVGLVLFVGCGGGAAAKTPGVDAGPDIIAEAGVDAPIDVALTMVNYRLTSVVGTFSGDGVNVQTAPARTDTLTLNTCTFTSTGTAANQMAFIGAADLTKTLSVTGTWTCPPGMSTSTGAPATCTTPASNNPSNMLQATVGAAGWADDSVVTLTVVYPPGAIPACSYATVVVAAPGWGMTGTTTAGKFKALTPFTVSFKGGKMLTSDTKTSNVSWDFTMTIEPSL
jgi:hypothetical protein